jgi:hypothetical protein
MKKYILTRQHNEYDQYGEYFVAWFAERPTAVEVQAAVKRDEESEIDEALATHILSGGGRQTSENVWWHLKQVSSANASGQPRSTEKGQSL